MLDLAMKHQSQTRVQDPWHMVHKCHDRPRTGGSVTLADCPGILRGGPSSKTIVTCTLSRRAQFPDPRNGNRNECFGNPLACGSVPRKQEPDVAVLPGVIGVWVWMSLWFKPAVPSMLALP